jgi:hypothetical protein
MATAHTINGIHSDFIFMGFILIVAEMKFTAPALDTIFTRNITNKALLHDACLKTATCFNYK